MQTKPQLLYFVLPDDTVQEKNEAAVSESWEYYRISPILYAQDE